MDKLTDLMKFGIMILIYTGYMTWWASGVSHTISSNTVAISDHILADSLITTSTIQLAMQVKGMQEHQERSGEMLLDTIETHAKCGALMEAMMRRLDRLEEERD